MGGALIAAALTYGGPAHAVECYTSLSADKLGEVTATAEVDGTTGKVVYQMVSWTPERTGGEETTFFARPQLLLDFMIDGEGKLSGPDKADVLVSRISDFRDRGTGAAPPMNQMRVRVKRPDAEPFEWEWSAQSRGQVMLARVLKQKMPQTLAIEVLDKSDKLVASADFAFSRMDEVRAMMTKAKAATDKRVAALQAQAAAGTPATKCPAG